MNETKDKLYERYEILLALKLFTENAHEIIDLLIQSDNASDCIEHLTDKFGIKKDSAQAIIDIQIKRLSRIQRDDLDREIAEVEATLKNDKLTNVRKIMKDSN